MADEDRQAKRLREVEPEVKDIMVWARKMWQRKNPYERRSAQQEDRDFRDSFGCGPFVALAGWTLLSKHHQLPPGGTLEHWLWTLLFMKEYPKTRALRTLCGGPDAKTIRGWTWQFMDSLADLESYVLIFDNRFKGDRLADCTMSIDCVDFAIPNYGPGFASFKFKGKSGLRYEIGLCIQTGHAVWINGPFPCGQYNDITIFRDSLLSNLTDGERVEADDGYIGEAPLHIKCPKSFVNPPETEFMQQRVRNRQETINKRLKDWSILRNMFRHREKVSNHGSVVRSILILEQIAIEQGEPLFHTGYKDPPFPTTNEESEDDSSSSSMSL